MLARPFWLLFTLSLVTGAVIMRIVTSWGDSGVAGGLILAAAGVFGFLGPDRAWLFAFAVSSWIAVLGLAHGHPAALFALVVGLVGAYLGAAARRLIASMAR